MFQRHRNYSLNNELYSVFKLLASFHLGIKTFLLRIYIPIHKGGKTTWRLLFYYCKPVMSHCWARAFGLFFPWLIQVFWLHLACKMSPNHPSAADEICRLFVFSCEVSTSWIFWPVLHSASGRREQARRKLSSFKKIKNLFRSNVPVYCIEYCSVLTVHLKADNLLLPFY